jgi:hypothetical protein
VTDVPSKKRLEALIEENEKPWRSEEAVEIATVELDKNQSVVADMFGCSTPTISNWVGKHNIGEEKRDGKTNEGSVCPRCGVNDTPDNPANEFCTECMDYIRERDSMHGIAQSFSDAVVNAKGRN